MDGFRETEDTYDRVETWANTGYVDCCPPAGVYKMSRGSSHSGAPLVKTTTRSCSQSGASQSNTDSAGTSASIEETTPNEPETTCKATGANITESTISRVLDVESCCKKKNRQSQLKRKIAYLLSLDGSLTHRVISDRVHRLLVTLSYFRPDRFVQLLSLIPILILLLYLLVSIDLEYTGFVTSRSLGESN